MPAQMIPPIPDMTAGIPCRLLTPHVSWTPSFLVRKG